MMTTMCLMEGRFLSSGQHQKLLPFASTPQPVMCGAMAVCCMRYGVLDTDLSRKCPTKRYYNYMDEESIDLF